MIVPDDALQPNDPIKLIVFDFDGTLVDSNTIKRSQFFVVGGRVGASKADIAAILDSINGDRFTIFMHLAKLKIPNAWRARLIGRRMARQYSRICEKMIVKALYQEPDVRSFLRQIAGAGVAIALNTATPTRSILRILRRADLRRYFGLVRGGYAQKRPNLEHALVTFGVSRRETLVVGDSEDDRLSAQEVGCRYLDVRLTEGAPVDWIAGMFEIVLRQIDAEVAA